MNAYLPHTIRLPFGYLVTIKCVAPRTLKRLADGTEVMGLWHVETRTIYIDKTMEERDQRYTLTHEMMHAFADWQHHTIDMVDKGARDA